MVIVSFSKLTSLDVYFWVDMDAGRFCMNSLVFQALGQHLIVLSRKSFFWA